MRIDRGTCKVSLWPTRNNGGMWCPRDETIYDLGDIPEVEAIVINGAQAIHIIVAFDSIEDMMERLPAVEAEILAIIERRARPIGDSYTRTRRRLGLA